MHAVECQDCNLRSLAGTRNESGSGLDTIPRHIDSTGERNISMEGASVLHLTHHDNIHRSRSRVGDVLQDKRRKVADWISNTVGATGAVSAERAT